ncbi:unnamed protein product [Prorocentrum cordatum]|uniref:Methyltransferase domain-containing protein n=1 Tax=Prorocentrum cordatum TaxID=2364126 RepID=A0ABN9W931_9DINO|nr:unnamed protein product [Polarella glacialis]
MELAPRSRSGLPPGGRTHLARPPAGRQRYATGQGSEWYAARSVAFGGSAVYSVNLGSVCGPDSPLGEAALRPPCRVLELGCGDKPLAPGMAADGFSVVAVDFSEEAVRQASGSSGRRRGPGRVDYAAADVRALPFAGGSFGAVVDKGCFDALRSAHCAQALGEVCRVLQPGGRFVCISNAEQLLRAHARRVPGWSCVPGAPFVLAGVDDEVFLHCYRRLGHEACHARPSHDGPVFHHHHHQQ